MWWIVLTVIFAIGALVSFAISKVTETEAGEYLYNDDGTRKRDANGYVRGVKETRPYIAGRYIGFGWVVLWLLVTALFSVKPVSAGEVGIVRQFGGIVGQESEGVSIIAPWQSIEKHSIRTQRHTFEGVTAASSETQDVYLTVTINYSISERNVQGLIRNVGGNWFDVLIPTRVNQYVKQETAKWPTIEIIPNREAIRQAVLMRLQSDLGENYSITVSDFLLDNISFSPEYLTAIEQKQVATENAEAEKNRTEQVQEVANQGVIQATGQAEQQRVLAQGQADANALIDASLTANLIQWEAIQQIGPNVNVALVPSGEGIILDPATLLAPQVAED